MKNLLIPAKNLSQNIFFPSDVMIITDEGEDVFCECSQTENRFLVQESFVWHPKRKY